MSDVRRFAGTITLVRKDNVHRTVTIDNVLITGSTVEEIQANPYNVTRALKWAKGLTKEEINQPDKWRIKSVLPTVELGLIGGGHRFHNGGK